MTFKKLKSLKELAKYQANIQSGITLRMYIRRMDKWKQYSQREALINSLINNFSDFDVTNAKLDELNGKHIKFMIQLIAVMKNL